MKKIVLALIVLFALVAVAATADGLDRPDRSDSGPAAAERVCPRGSTPALIRGVRQCLRRGRRCSRADDRRYHRYGFHCHTGRLARARHTAVVIVAAGDIACEPGASVTPTECRHRQTARLLNDPAVDAVLALGDSQYDEAAYSEFTGDGAFAETWGRKKTITRPVPGNHEYHLSGASGYFDYFGSAAGERGKGYYSFDLGSWHLIALNSEIPAAGGSAQEQWLRADLRATRKPCILAYWHRPRFSSGRHGSSTRTAALWDALYRARADLVLSAHDHDYERFALQDPRGHADANGIRQFVVGTGGASHYAFGSTIERNSQVRNDTTFGVLELTLRPGAYEWRFVPEAGGRFTDTGSTRCH